MEIDIKSFHRALAQIAQDRGIAPEKIIETLEAAIASAYKKDYGKKGQKIKSKFDSVSGNVKFWQVKLVVDEKLIYSEEEIEKLKERKEIIFAETAEHEEGKKVVFNSEKHMMLDEAKKIKPGIKIGEELEIPLQSQTDYGRIAAQTAKQVILQKIREVEKEAVFNEYKSKEGEITSGVVQRIEGHVVFVDIGKTLGVLNREEQIPGEFYRPGQRLKFYILKVDETSKGPIVVLSRSYPKLISKLFELEVPEIATGVVEVKAIAREPGFRTKVAVESKEEGVDPIGSIVGQRGTRIMAVINELGGEKIDVVEWKDDPEKFIANALAPAKILEVKIDKKNTAKVSVPEDQLSLAIGKDGRNVRLAANLTGWKIDIKGVAEAEGAEKEAEEKKEGKEEKEGEEKKEEDKQEKKEPLSVDSASVVTLASPEPSAKRGSAKEAVSASGSTESAYGQTKSAGEVKKEKSKTKKEKPPKKSLAATQDSTGQAKK